MATDDQPRPYQPWPVLSREPAGWWEPWPYEPWPEKSWPGERRGD